LRAQAHRRSRQERRSQPVHPVARIDSEIRGPAGDLPVPVAHRVEPAPAADFLRLFCRLAFRPARRRLGERALRRRRQPLPRSRGGYLRSIGSVARHERIDAPNAPKIKALVAAARPACARSQRTQHFGREHRRRTGVGSEDTAMNYLRTATLLAALTALFMGVGYLIGGESGALTALLVAAAMNLASYWNADKLVLAMHDAHEVDEMTAPDLVRLVRDLAQRAGLPMPRVYLMDNPQPNAFATGRNPEHAAVAVTTGLLQMLPREEIAGVIAHELAHVRNRATLTMPVTATIAGAISMLAQFGLFFGGHRDNNGAGLIGTIAMVILAPIAAMLVQMAISRTREYAADNLGARISGRP